MRKALMPIVIVAAVLCAVMAAAWWYESRYGLEGPFKPHGHGH